MAGSRVLSAVEAARAPVRRVEGKYSGGMPVYYGARPGSDGKMRMGLYTAPGGKSGRGFSPNIRSAVAGG